jgi:hypothetical protein
VEKELTMMKSRNELREMVLAFLLLGLLLVATL